MKKAILFLLAILFSISVSSQEYFGVPVQLGVTPVANTSDFILANGTHSGENGIISKTAITVQQLTDAISGGVTPTLQAVLDTGNTSTTGINLSNSNLVSSFGLSTATVSPTDVSVEGRFGGVHVLESSIARWGANPASQRTVLSFENPSSVSSVILRNISGTVALTSELTGAQNLQSVTAEGSTTTLGIETGSYTTQSGTHLVELYPTSLAMYEYAGNKYTEVSPSNMSVSNATGSTSVQASGVTVLEGGNPKSELTKDDLRLYKGVNYGSVQTAASLGANRTYTMPDKDINVAGLKDIVAFVGNETVEHTNASLNSKYPIANHPIGTMETLRFNDGLTVKVLLYVRVTSTEWVEFVGASL